MSAFIFLHPSPSLRSVSLLLVSGSGILDALEIEDGGLDSLGERIVDVLETVGVSWAKVFVSPHGAGGLLLEWLSAHRRYPNQTDDDTLIPLVSRDTMGLVRERLANGKD